MSDIAITLENLGKSYLLGHNAKQVESYTALRDVISRNALNLARKTRDMVSGRAIVQGDEVEEFWALKDVTLQIKRGDRVGIIGRNGAGKSTLLKILSRITEPTTGRIKISGRVASLLEVGTGFHPELTGKENIFLNGAILGMTRKEIQRKFDEIVDFSEVERFLDTPVKRYSSGMYVRLAFAVAAHLEPEILIVDEVLAVGDREFQDKCLGKMNEVSRAGRTVLFVSHNLSAIRTLCTHGILLSNGLLSNSGDINSVISAYTSKNLGLSKAEKLWSINNAPGDEDLKLLRISVSQESLINTYFNDSKEIYITVEFYASFEINKGAICCNVNNSNGETVLHTQSDLTGILNSFKKGKNTFQLKLPKFSFRSGTYTVSVAGTIPYVKNFFSENQIVTFDVITENREVNRYPDEAWKGFFNPQFGIWSTD